MLQTIIDLGRQIEGLSSNLKSLDKEFSTLSYTLLNELVWDMDLKELEAEISHWMINDKLPEQVNIYNVFGQPPLTVFNNDRFVIDLYFWRDADTSIHSHAFCGAFKVLYGTSLHEDFKVTPTQKFSDDVMLTNIEVVNSEVLKAGSVKEILRGDEFNHRVVHLGNPTVTLCIRTLNDKQLQWHHFSNGLSIAKNPADQFVIKKLFFLDYLIAQNNPSVDNFIDKLVSNMEISMAMNLYEQLTYDSMGLADTTIEQFFAKVALLYSNEKWFSVYENFFLAQQDYQVVMGDQTIDRLREFCLNHNYSENDFNKLAAKL